MKEATDNALLTDLYQLTMLQAYFEDRRRGVFDVHTMDFSVKDFPPDRKPAG